jgi:hypothetical protein
VTHFDTRLSFFAQRQASRSPAASIIVAWGHPLSPLIFLPEQARLVRELPADGYTPRPFLITEEHGANQVRPRTNYLSASSRRDCTMQLRSQGPVVHECPLAHIQINGVARS